MDSAADRAHQQWAVAGRRVSRTPRESETTPLRVMGVTVAPPAQREHRLQRSLSERRSGSGEPARGVPPRPGVHQRSTTGLTNVLPVGADPASQSAVRTSGYLTVIGRLRDLQARYKDRPAPNLHQDLVRRKRNLSARIMRLYRNYERTVNYLDVRKNPPQTAFDAYLALEETARESELRGDRWFAAGIRNELHTIDRFASEQLRQLSEEHKITAAPPAGALPRLPTMAAESLTDGAIESQTRYLREFDWTAAQRLLCQIRHRSSNLGSGNRHIEFQDALDRISGIVRQGFLKVGGHSADLTPMSPDIINNREQEYRAIEELARKAEESGDRDRAYSIRQALETINHLTSRITDELVRKHGSLDVLAASINQSTQSGAAELGAIVPADPAARLDGAIPGVSVSAAQPISPSWLDDDFAVERALIDGKLPAGFDASRLIAEARMIEEFGFHEQLLAGQLPIAIDAVLEEYEATDEAGSNALFIEYLRSLKENIDFALRAAYPGRANPEWLDQVSTLLGHRARVAPQEAASAPRFPELGVTGTASLFETDAEAMFSATLPSAPGRTETGVVAPRPPNYEAIVERFSSDDALLEVEYLLQTGRDRSFGWSSARRHKVLDDLYRLNDAAQEDPAAAAAMDDIDWSAIEALAQILEVPPLVDADVSDTPPGPLSGLEVDERGTFSN